jgi:hypothetical protein
MSWTKAQEHDFVLVLFAMGELFNEPVSALRAEMFCRAVEDLPFEAIALAAQAHVKAKTFFPKPAELRQGVEGNLEDRAELAWQFVLREIKRVGWTGTPAWPDAETARAALGLYGGTWRTLCENLPAAGPELLGYRKQFVASFGAAARQAAVGALPMGREEATAALEELRRALVKRSLPTGKL